MTYIDVRATIQWIDRQLKLSQWYDRATLNARQLEQLGHLTSWLDEYSPAFANRLGSASMTSADLSRGGLVDLPPASRRWFQENKTFTSVLPNGHGPTFETSTSGSTGEPLSVRRTWLNSMSWHAMTLRQHEWACSDFSHNLAIVRAHLTSITPSDDWGAPTNLFHKTGPSLALPITLSNFELLNQVVGFNAQHLLIFPNSLKQLINTLDQTSSRLNLSTIRTVGEVVTPELRQLARTIFDLPINDAYSSQELGCIAIQCPLSGLYHSMSETHIVEVLREDGSVCAEGETGNLVITDLLNFATPLIRYSIGDKAEVGPTCPCGRGLSTLTRILGRHRNLVKLPDGTRVWPFTGAMGDDGFAITLPIKQYQMIQHSDQDIEVKLVSARPITIDEEARMTDRIYRGLGHRFNLRFTYFQERIPTDGKFEEFICLV